MTKTRQIYLAAVCGPIPIPNGQTNYSSSAVDGRYPVNTEASFQCDYGFTLHPEISEVLDFISLLRDSGYTGVISYGWTCQDSGNWTRETPVCFESNDFYTFS